VEQFSALIREHPTPDWTPVASGVEVRHLVGGYGASIEMYRMSPGRRFERHEHPFPEMGVFLSGRGRLLIGDDERNVSEGDSFYIPSGTPHGFAVARGAPVVTMNVSVPAPPYLRGPVASEILRLARRSVRVDHHDAEESPKRLAKSLSPSE
jgi:quercetin dioxygenase-like cupin family protein